MEQGAPQAKILVVDDHQTNVDILRSFLEFEGYQVLEAHDGVEALEQVEKECPDLILLDVLMPRMNGFEACRVLKSWDKTRFTPIVMVTALQSTEDKVKGFEAGAVELMARVRSLLRAKRLHDELNQSLERLRQQNEQLRRLEHLREGLTALIVHDMNNPLTNIIGNLDLMARIPPPLDEHHRETLEFARAASKRLLRRVRNLLDIGHLEEGQLQIHREMTQIDEFVTEIVASLNLPMIRPGVRIEMQLAPARAMLDRALIERVLSNLLDGAIKYTRSEETILIRGDRDAASGYYVIGVSDQGPTIPDEHKEAIFDKYLQVEAREAGIPRGVALSLTFCKMAVEAHGGRIWIESGKDVGNVYTFSIPLQAA